MMENMTDKLLKKIDETRCPCVVGLDPRIEQIPSFLKEHKKHDPNQKRAVAEIFLEFNQLIIDQIKDVVPAVKPQIAFYEQYGHYGLKAFEDTVKYAQENGLIVIGDAKRNDIGSTAQGYAKAFLGKVKGANDQEIKGIDVDYLTVTPYLGSDGVKPFIDVCKQYHKGIFCLVKTSNPSSGELQDKNIEKENKTIYELVAEYVAQSGSDLIGVKGYSSIGAVVGATYPEQAKKLRKLMPKTMFLVPGYGAQGGGAADVVPCFNEDGYGAIVNSSRGIIFAYKQDEYKNTFKENHFHFAARQAAVEMQKDIYEALKNAGKLPKGW